MAEFARDEPSVIAESECYYISFFKSIVR
ncbi:uncharacterized protein G2W53_010930 [Senna tora]|uniref:Uncharacterized protein n=1 Tax=Senna tora TaxID=362788 RepID=A0A835CBW2_9FABA|nr:uncharacterized protein G2W53_010930 [Senna tora]